MKALVTGASGFVGSYLVETLLKRGESVAILCRPNSNLWRLGNCLSRVTVIRGDFTEPFRAEAAIEAYGPDTVFHLAWDGVTERDRDSPEQIDKNLMGSVALLRLALKLGCRTFAGLGSQAEYGPRNALLAEDCPPQPNTAYGVAKLCTYLIGNHLTAQTDMRFVWLRLFSCYGPKDNADWLLPYVVRTLVRRQRPSLTPGEQVWDYLYVADAAEAIYLAAANERAEGVFNVGSGIAQPLRKIVERVRDIINPDLPLGFGDRQYSSNQVMHLQADISRLQTITGWRPQTDLPDGLYRTVHWFMENSQEQASSLNRSDNISVSSGPSVITT